ncbi:MAG: formate-nitrite transporter family protein [Actinomycetota bacterium]|jgi:formate/nitrite transporter FocA (FNT family)|nr:formate-nitrite transporter family protein [Actinomycetota bacterium]
MTSPVVAQEDSEETFDRLVDEGQQRLGRSWTGLTSTALLGGIDVGAGAIALLIVENQTHDVVLAGLAFSIGFIALTLANSELFTEGFLIPVAAVVAKKANVLALLRLWVMSIVGNLIGGWVLMGIAMAAFPNLRTTALEAGKFYISLGWSMRAFTLAIIGGFVITLMTHMQHGTDSDGVKLVPAVVMGFLLGAGKLNHAIVASLLTFAALHVGAPFGYVDWFKLFLLSSLGNMVGGLGLVTLLRLLQVPHKVAAERDQNPDPPTVPGVTGKGDTEPD